jgi:long-chain acyl-CoA synthetase
VIEAARRHGAGGCLRSPGSWISLGAKCGATWRQQGKVTRFEALEQKAPSWPIPLQILAFWRTQLLLGWRLRVVVVGGAPLAPELRRFWQMMGYLIVQGYDLTETAPIVTITNPFDRGEGVGHPVGAQEVKIGPEGEVRVRGPNVTPGYLGRPREEQFEGEWFRTGDVGEIDAKGRLQIRGRLKDVIVTPEGEKAHSEDVEEALLRVPGVEEASVIGLPSERGERVHPVLRLREGTDAGEVVSEANVRLEPRQRISGPTVWPHRDFPHTATGKVRKPALRDAIVRLQEGRQPEAVDGDASRDLRDLISRMSRLDPAKIQEQATIGEGLGLGSLDLVELAAAIEDHFGVSVPEQTLSQATVASLTAMIKQESGKPPPEPPGHRPENREARAPAPRAESAEPAQAVAEAGPPSLSMPRWARRVPFDALRRLFEKLVMIPLVRTFARLEIEGLEHVRRVEHPFLLVANHRSNLDTVLLKVVVPQPSGGRIVPAMTTRLHRTFFEGEHGSLPPGPGIDRGASGAASLQRLAHFRNWECPQQSFVRGRIGGRRIQPADLSRLQGRARWPGSKGRELPEGQMGQFRRGIGVFARELRLPVVPCYLEGTAAALPSGANWPRAGRLRVVFGAALTIEPDAEATKATEGIEQAVRELAPPGTVRADQQSAPAEEERDLELTR